jgi:hypothetical protein
MQAQTTMIEAEHRMSKLLLVCLETAGGLRRTGFFGTVGGCWRNDRVFIGLDGRWRRVWLRVFVLLTVVFECAAVCAPIFSPLKSLPGV